MIKGSKNRSFREKNRLEKITTVLVITLLIAILVCLVLGIYFFGMVGIFKLFGVQYSSIWSLVIFVVSFFVLGVISELFFKAIFELFFEHVTGKGRIFLNIIFEAISNWLILYIVDAFITSITLPLEIEMIIALLIAILESAFNDDKKTEISAN